MTPQEIKQQLEEVNPEALLLPPNYDSALVGIGERCGQPALAIYNYTKLIKAYVAAYEREGDLDELYVEATKYVDFNIVGARLGENTPLIMRDENPD